VPSNDFSRRAWSLWQKAVHGDSPPDVPLPKVSFLFQCGWLRGGHSSRELYFRGAFLRRRLPYMKVELKEQIG
jgi:hypothetical protein